MIKLLDKTILVSFPVQMVSEPGVAVMVGLGFTVMSTVIASPEQEYPLTVGVTVYLTTAMSVDVFVSVWLILVPQELLQFEKPVVDEPEKRVAVHV